MILSNWLKVGVGHGVSGSDSLSMVISQHHAQKVKSLIRYELVVLLVDKLGPRLSWNGVGGEQILVVTVESESVLVQIGVELLSAENFGNLDKLVVVVTTLEERLTFENHASKHAAERPNV